MIDKVGSCTLLDVNTKNNRAWERTDAKGTNRPSPKAQRAQHSGLHEHMLSHKPPLVYPPPRAGITALVPLLCGRLRRDPHPILMKFSLAPVVGVQHTGELLYNTEASDEILPLYQGLHPLKLLLFHNFLRLHGVQEYW